MMSNVSMSDEDQRICHNALEAFADLIEVSGEGAFDDDVQEKVANLMSKFEASMGLQKQELSEEQEADGA